MATTQIDTFDFPSAGIGTELYKVFYNDISFIFSVVCGGDDGLLTTVSAGQRGKTEGQSFGAGFKATLNYPFAYLDDMPIDPDTCDLELNAVTVNETTQGGNNGEVTVSATSSFATIEVSIDGVNWFATSHLFTGLTPDNYTAYARDANGCEASGDFVIDAFNNPIEGGFSGGLPQVQVSAGNISRWNAVFNPIVLNFQDTPDPLKKNFRYEIEITSGSTIVIGTYSPNTSGFTRADISGFLKTLVNAKDKFQYDVLNWRDLDRAASFTIRYRQIWDASSSVWYNAPQPLYVTYSALQLGSKYGGNMAEYVTFLTEPNPDLKAKWLTKFEEPTAWVGLPYDNSFILSEYVVAEPIKVRTISLDLNYNVTGGVANNAFLLNNDAGYVLGTDLSRLIIQPGALPPISDDGIFEALGINRLMLAGNPGTGVSYFQIQLYTGDDNNPNFITQPLTIEVKTPCNDKYVYLKWINTLGGWDYWKFGVNNFTSVTTATDIQIDRNVFDYENDDTIADVIKKSAITKIGVGEIIGKNKVSGLRELYTSVKVQMLVNSNPIKWQTVIINNGSFDVKNAKSNFSEMKFTLNLPEMNIQQQ